MKRNCATMEDWLDSLIIVRGGGDIATGTIYKLYQCGFPLLVLEISDPSCIRRSISFCEAMQHGETTVEGVTAKRVEDVEDAYRAYREKKIPVIEDGDGRMIRKLDPAAVVDAILAKRNLGTSLKDAPIVIGVGPGFCAGLDVHAVIETQRGHNLGRVIYKGEAAANTGVPGIIAGFGKERVIHAPAAGNLRILRDIGSLVSKEEVIAAIHTPTGEEVPVTASLTGLVRGMIRNGYPVKKGLKIVDIDPRKEELENCRRISDKARCVAGGVLEALLHLDRETDYDQRENA